MDKITQKTSSGPPSPIPPVELGLGELVLLRVKLEKNPKGQWTFDRSEHTDAIISIGKRQLVKVFSDEAPFRIQPGIPTDFPRGGAPAYPFEKLHDHVNAHMVHILGPAVSEAYRKEDPEDKGTVWKMAFELLREDGSVREVWDPHIIVTP